MRYCDAAVFVKRAERPRYAARRSGGIRLGSSDVSSRRWTFGEAAQYQLLQEETCDQKRVMRWKQNKDAAPATTQSLERGSGAGIFIKIAILSIVLVSTFAVRVRTAAVLGSLFELGCRLRCERLSVHSLSASVAISTVRGPAVEADESRAPLC